MAETEDLRIQLRIALSERDKFEKDAEGLGKELADVYERLHFARESAKVAEERCKAMHSAHAQEKAKMMEETNDIRKKFRELEFEHSQMSLDNLYLGNVNTSGGVENKRESARHRRRRSMLSMKETLVGKNKSVGLGLQRNLSNVSLLEEESVATQMMRLIPEDISDDDDSEDYKDKIHVSNYNEDHLKEKISIMEQEEIHMREKIKNLEDQLSEKVQKETKLQTELSTQIEHYRTKSMAVNIEKESLVTEVEDNHREKRKELVLKHEKEVKELIKKESQKLEDERSRHDEIINKERQKHDDILENERLTFEQNLEKERKKQEELKIQHLSNVAKLETTQQNQVENLKKEYEVKIQEERAQVTESLNKAKEMEVQRWKTWLEDANTEVTGEN